MVAGHCPRCHSDHVWWDHARRTMRCTFCGWQSGEWEDRTCGCPCLQKPSGYPPSTELPPRAKGA